MHDLLRRIGDLSAGEVAARLTSRSGPRRSPRRWSPTGAVWIHLAGERRLIAEDAGRYRDGLGAMPPSGVPEAFLEPVPEALRSIVARYARAYGPLPFGRGRGPLRARAAGRRAALAVLEADGTVVRGELRLGGFPRERCDAEVVRRLLARCSPRCGARSSRRTGRALGRFLPDWQRVDRPAAARGADALRDALATLQGLAPWAGAVGDRGAAAAAWSATGSAGLGRAGGAGRDRLGRGGGRRRRRRPRRDLLP